ncbi:unnamed protein product [Effrenium voratum]|nr:unnamed protein product [Effrenium voratum]
MSALVLPSLDPGARSTQPQSARAPDRGGAQVVGRPPLSARSLQESVTLDPLDPLEPEDDTFNLSTSTAMSAALRISDSEWGSAAASLMQADVAGNQRLRGQLAQMRLSDFFNVYGGPHFKRLSISFAAKQNSQVGFTFGSTSDLHASVADSDMHADRAKGEKKDKQSEKSLDSDSLEDDKGMVGGSKAFLAASEARAKDLILTREKAEKLLLEVKEEERLRTADVDHRRLSLLFAEIPDFEEALPKMVSAKSLIPLDMVDEQETAEKQSIERQNGFLLDKNFIEGSQMSWNFIQAEVLVIAKCAQRWCLSTRSNLTMGIDRPTFCRLLFDLELVDQQRVPYYWAVCLFDSLAQPTRLCPPHAHHAATAPIHLVVNRFRLISLLDAIVRQHCDVSSRGEVLERMKQGAKKLKAYQEKEGKPEKEGSAPSAPNAHDAEAKGRIKARDAAIRERLISAMLIEPEVLDMVFVHRGVFQAFFERYAPSGHMQYTELWQFCADFHLVPQLVSEQQLRKAYNAAECFGVLPPHCSRELSKQPPKARKAGQNTAARSRRGTSNPPSGVSGPSLSAPSAASSASPAVSRMSMMSLSGISEEPKSESLFEERKRDSTVSNFTEDSEVKLECDTVFDVNAFTETVCRIAFLYLSFYGSTLQQGSSSCFKICWLLTYLRHVSSFLPFAWEEPAAAELRPCLLQPKPGPGNRKVPKRRPKVQPMAPRLKPGKSTREAAQSVNRLKTTNSVREAAKALGKAALVVRAMTESGIPRPPPRRVDSSSDEEPEESATCSSSASPKLALSETAAKDRIEALTKQVAASFQKTRQPRAVLSQLLPLEDLFKVEAGRPAVEDGVCQLCGRCAPGSESGAPAVSVAWGDPCCRGCSVVDCLHLEDHPFARLMFPRAMPGVRILRPKAAPCSGARVRPAFEAPLSPHKSHALLD